MCVFLVSPQLIVQKTNEVLLKAGPSGHILNVGHGVIQGTPENAVGVFCETARRSGELFAKQGVKAQNGRQPVTVGA